MLLAYKPPTVQTTQTSKEHMQPQMQHLIQWYWLSVSLPWKTVWYKLYSNLKSPLKPVVAASWRLPRYEKQATLNKIVPVIECTWYSILQVVSDKEQAVKGLLLSEVLSMKRISLPYGFNFPRMDVVPCSEYTRGQARPIIPLHFTSVYTIISQKSTHGRSTLKKRGVGTLLIVFPFHYERASASRLLTVSQCSQSEQLDKQ